MKYIKISNLINTQGVADYKGLDLTKIITGSQIYPDNENVAYFKYDGEPIEHPDITVIDETTYNNVKNSLNKPPQLSLENRVSALEEALLQALGL